MDIATTGETVDAFRSCHPLTGTLMSYVIRRSAGKSLRRLGRSPIRKRAEPPRPTNPGVLEAFRKALPANSLLPRPTHAGILAACPDPGRSPTDAPPGLQGRL